MTGELPISIFDLETKRENALTPLKYDLFVQRFDSELLFTGHLEATFELVCMRSLHPFQKTIHLPQAAISLEIVEDGLIDATEALREEILIELPTNPRCEEGDEEMKCEIDPKHLAVDNGEKIDIETPPGSHQPNPWAALDELGTEDN